MSRTLRFNLSKEMTLLLTEFHNKNKDQSKKEYKKQWEMFSKDNSAAIVKEERSLINVGFSGDIHKKLFTSVKYYISKKSTEKPEPKDRRTYVHIDKNILESMNDHIVTNKDDGNYTPAKGYSDFCERYEQELIIERTRLKTTTELNDKEIEVKIKKTYKNRYFILCK